MAVGTSRKRTNASIKLLDKKHKLKNSAAAQKEEQEGDLSSNLEGVDDRAIARLEFIVSQLEKRQKIVKFNLGSYAKIGQDQQYIASNAKSAMTEAGIKAPERDLSWLNNERKRMFECSSVECITSSQFAMKKRKRNTVIDLDNLATSYMENDALRHFLEYDITFDYELMSKASTLHYSIRKGNNRFLFFPKSCESIARYTPFIPCLPFSMISLGQALAFYPKPRIVVEAVMPFNVVHANSGYFRLSGLTNGTAMHSPLSELVVVARGENSSLQRLLKCIQKTEVGQHVSVDITTQSVDITSGNQVKGSLRCQLYAFPIVADVNSAYVKDYQSFTTTSSTSGLRDVTHFLIELNYHDSTLDMFDEFMQDASGGAELEHAITLLG